VWTSTPLTGSNGSYSATTRRWYPFEAPAQNLTFRWREVRRLADGMQTFQRLFKGALMNLEQFKQKYAPALEAVQKNNVRLDHLHVQDGKLFLQGAAPNENAKNRVWDAIKSVDPTYSDLTCDLTIDASLPAPAAAPAGQKYTVQPGDSLSKIAKRFYGDANSYMKIFEANKSKLADPNKIQPGQELLIPAA
jgi:hypothetical protein